MTLTTTFLASAVLIVCGAESSDFETKAARLFSKSYYFHRWNEVDHVVDGEDWSLPPSAKAASVSGVLISPRRVSADFPCSIVKSVVGTWREIEPREGEYDFSRFRQAILEASAGGTYAVKIGLQASVWETRYFRSLTDKTIVRTTPGTAPLWMTRYGVPMIEETPNSSIPFQLVNLDIHHPEYHQRYLKLVRAFGESGIPRMPEVRFVYLHDKSASRGEEGWTESDQPTSGERWLRYQERLRAWADAFGPDCHKLMTVSSRPHILEVCYPLGIGQRNGFVENYLMHAPNPMLGQLVDSDGYLTVDEAHPLVADNRASGDENEEYGPELVVRFGPIETFPHRYHESMLRVLQMRRNFVWAESGSWLINPPLLHYVALELGHNVQTAPDAWCYLRESLVPNRGVANQHSPRPIKNFERWLYQRDDEGARTVAAEKVPVPPQMFAYHKSHLYDMTARRTDVANEQRRIRFGVDDNFLSGGPHRVAVKVTYFDRDNAEWELAFHSSPTAISSRRIVCGETGRAKTATFILSEAYFPQKGYTGCDLEIRAVRGDAVIRMVRVIRLVGAQDVR